MGGGDVNKSASVYNIPAGVPFLRSLAQHIMDGGVCARDRLDDLRILLPTRRACRSLQQMFLELNGGKAMIMPQLHPLGDADEEELSLSLAEKNAALDIPPQISPMRRQMLLAKLIMARPDFDQGYDRALGLAGALGALLDQVYTENLDLRDLTGLVPDEFADHWRITLDFLEILALSWPEILAENGVIDGADRRNRLLLALAAHWADSPPDYPVLVAGTTGSIPATAQVLRSVSQMPRGMIVLPGLDAEIDEESWAALEESHPQYGLKKLLRILDVERAAVKSLPTAQDLEVCQMRRGFLREAMRPALTSAAWGRLKHAGEVAWFGAAYQNLELCVCENEVEEAKAISVLLRGALEDPKAKACLVTPDRSLAARVISVCKRWGITVDDSAGYPLIRSSLGGFIKLVWAVVERRAAPKDVLALLQHPDARFGLEYNDFVRARAALDIALRGLSPAQGFAGLRAHIERRERLDEEVRQCALDFLVRIEEVFAASDYIQGGALDFAKTLRSHLKLCEAVAERSGKIGAEILWAGAEGQAASSFFAELLLQGDYMDALSMDEYEGALDVFMNGVTLRRSYGVHPRLRILGQIEARMIDADFVVLSGLNEGTWPADTGTDPWMSRPMRKEFGLPCLERSIGLAAHDFVQGVCNPRVVITRSKRQGSAPSVPSRWLQRMDAVVQATGARLDERLEQSAALSWARGMDEAQAFQPVERPQPTPPVSARPKRLSVTQIETWLRDPYSIYAGSVLRLKMLDDLEKPVDAAARGQFMHDVLEDFVAQNSAVMPEDAFSVLCRVGQEKLRDLGDDRALQHLWWPRFRRGFSWFVEQEHGWRGGGAQPLLLEAKGEVKVGDGFVLSGRVDRVDRLASGQAAIIDYKTGGIFTNKQMQNGGLPQLPLEAFMLREGAFSHYKDLETAALSYWVVSGNRDGGKAVCCDDNVADIIEKIEIGLKDLIAKFSDEAVPYLCLPRSDQAPRFNDYLHLARVQEWAALDDAESVEEAA